MTSFLKLESGLPVQKLMGQLNINPQLWDQNPARLGERGPHYQTHDIWIRCKDETENLATGDWSNFCDQHYSIWYPSAEVLTESHPLIFALMSAVQGENLGAVLLYKVPAGKEILPHADTGWHPNFYAKFNIALQSQDGCSFYYPDTGEEMRAKTGELHWFKNTIKHGVRNNSDKDQLILTCCIKTRRFAEN